MATFRMVDKSEVNKANKKLLRSLHYAFGYDFEMPHDIMAFKGNYTTNAILKELKKNHVNLESGKIIILDHIDGSNNNEYCASELNHNGKVETDLANYYSRGSTTPCGFSHYQSLSKHWAKKAFEERRKCSSVEGFVIVQTETEIEMRANKNAYKTEFNEYTRYEIAPNTYAKNGVALHYRCTNTHSSIWGADIHELNSRNEYTAYYSRGICVNNRYDLVDKSGYLVNLYRQDLAKRANQLRADRAKAKADEYNTDSFVAEVTAMYEKIKSEFTNRVVNAKNRDELCEITHKFDRFAWGSRCVENFVTKCKNKEIESVEHIVLSHKNVCEWLQAIATDSNISLN